jgi:hypothetical protein
VLTPNRSSTTPSRCLSLTQILRNFTFLTVAEPEIFPEQLVIDKDAQKADKILGIAMTLLTHFERRGFSLDLLSSIGPRVEQDLGGGFPSAILEVLLARQRFQTIQDGKAFFYLGVLLELAGEPEYRKALFGLKGGW